MPRNHNERCKDCKQIILKLLRAAFGDVDEQHNLKLPSKLEDYKNCNGADALEVIYKNLQAFRGFTEFVKAKTLPNVDYFIHSPQLIVEFDESQHFTMPRAIALQNYPVNLELGFDKDKWIEKCRKLNKRDNDPPCRDEQRAWYDTLRDFADVPTIRLLPEEAVWCNLDPAEIKDVEWSKNHILNKFPLSYSDKRRKNTPKASVIGLAFPEVGKHDLDYFIGLLDIQPAKLNMIVFPEGFETICANNGIAPESISEDSNVRLILNKYASTAKKYKVGVIVGFQVGYKNTLTSGGGNDQYCLCIYPQGESFIYHKHSTSKFNAFFDSNWSLENNIRTINMKDMNIGISVCHDSYISLISRLMAKKGADVWVNISYQNVRPNIWEPVHQARAVENNVISLCTLHRNSYASNPQTEPYAFSPNGKILLRDLETNKSIDELAENSRTGKIYFVDCHDYETVPFEPPCETDIASKVDKLSIIKANSNSIELDKYKNRFYLKFITLKDYFSPEVLWKHALQHHNRTVIFVISTKVQVWREKESDVLKTIKARTIEFSTVFIFLDGTDKILLSAYRSSNYKDSRVFYPSRFPVTVDSRFLKGLDSTCRISLGDCRNKDDKLYFTRIGEIIEAIESL